MSGTVKNNIRIRRTILELTQEQLAEQVGVTRQTIIAMEKGNYTPSVYLALVLAKTLSCTVEEIFHVENPA
ncbi:MAG: helix-turn-helix transcriptional regulator [Spirochaetales bacterium]|nr:helix-turn-helix transcriptional regulator [Spirochaetales bacterium]